MRSTLVLVSRAFLVLAVVMSPARGRAASSPDGPTLLRPDAGAEIRQNDPTAGCKDDKRMGYGFRLDLEWTGMSDAEGGYDVWVSRMAAKNPMVQSVVPTPSYHQAHCNSWIGDLNRDRWEWRVRARAADGRPGPWSPTGTFHFGPCRFKKGEPCEAGRGTKPPSAEDTFAIPATLALVRGDAPLAPPVPSEDLEQAPLATPRQISPLNGGKLHNFPRRTELNWERVQGAASYKVVVDCFHCCKTDAWCTDVEPLDRSTHDLAAPPFSFQWYGAQQGRWRVKAVGLNGEESDWSPWWVFDYRR